MCVWRKWVKCIAIAALGYSTVPLLTPAAPFDINRYYPVFNERIFNVWKMLISDIGNLHIAKP